MRIIANFGRSLALFVPTFFCLYATDLWALNLFVFISTYPVSPSDRLSGIWYGFMYLAGGAVLYLFVVGLWWLLIKTLWRNSPDWISKLRKLVKMVHGREDVARRLIEGNLKLFPDKSPDWACDKAISDLERDRRT